MVMDIPYELWNETSAEVADLKKQVEAPWPQTLLCPTGVGGDGVGAGEGHRELGGFGHFTCLTSGSSGESPLPACLAVGL